ncbi:MAG: mandelate racemase/muconate lactonizing enzyme family protein [Candidatus Bathyarchaeia archaeon]
MKITDMKATPVAVPLRESLPSKTPKYLQSVIVEVLTDEGIVGIGESHAALGGDVTKLILESVKGVILNEDPTDTEVLKKKLYAACSLTHLHIHAANWALSGIDMALWDIVGKSSRKPLHEIWGGAFRRPIEYYGAISRTNPNDIANQAKELIEEGFRTLYLKVGFDPDEDIECVKAIRETASSYQGRIKIRVDANQAWSPGEAIRIVNKLAKYDLELVDQPTLMYDLEGLARVRKAVEVPIASHESSWTFYNVLNIIRYGAADVIHIDPRFDAGFMGARISAGMAEAAGLPVLTHEWAMLGVSTAAYMQLIASTPNFTLANQGGCRNLADDVIKGGPLRLREGHLDLPEEPGIGVELDPEKVEKYGMVYERTFKGKGFSKEDATIYQLMAYRRYFGY